MGVEVKDVADGRHNLIHVANRESVFDPVGGKPGDEDDVDGEL